MTLGPNRLMKNIVYHVSSETIGYGGPCTADTGYGDFFVNAQRILNSSITSPVVKINMMGYADPKQVGSGLRQRLYSRTFIIGDVERPDQRFVYLVLDTQSGDTAVRHGILQGLFELGTEYAIYGQDNVAVTGTHSHSDPGAWLNYLLPQMLSCHCRWGALVHP